MNTEPSLHIVHQGGHSPLGQVIFIHGLKGHPQTTWESSGGFWPEWLQADFPAVAVCTVGYDAAATGWGGEARGLIDRAQTIAALLHGQRRDALPTVFVGHSLGGLVIKEMLFQSVDDPGWENRWIKDRAKGVVFLATPHAGSRIADWAGAMGWVARSSAVTEDLGTDSAYLEKLARWYVRETSVLDIKTIAFSETKNTEIKRKLLRRIFNARVVTRESADPNVPGVRPTDIEADHIDIAKPPSRNSIVYGNVSRFVDELLLTTDPEEEDQASASETDETRKGLSERLAEVADEALDWYRSEIVLKLLDSATALEELSGPDASARSDPKAQAEALATQLLAMTAEDAQGLLDQAHQRLSRSQQKRAATVCFDIARLLLPAIYNPAAICQARDQICDHGTYIINLNVRLELVADLIMAGATGRELQIEPPDKDGRFPENAYLKLDLPPNTGRGGLEAYIEAWDAYLWSKFGLDGDEPPDRVAFVDEELEHRALRRRPAEIYYVILPKDPKQREPLELAIQRLRSRYRHLLIVGLASDSSGLGAEARDLRHFRDMAYREGGTS